MRLLDRYKRNDLGKYNFEFEGLDFKRIKDIYEKDDLNIFQVKGIFKNVKNKYGISFSLICEDYIINVPESYYRMLELMDNDSDIVNEINNNNVYVSFNEIEYDNEHGQGITYSVDFLELDEVVALEEEKEKKE